MSRSRSAENPLVAAMALHQQGRLDEAEPCYLALLAHAPGDLDARHLLGVLRQQQGRAAEAAALIAPVLAAVPDSAAIHNNYGNALKGLGRFDEALACYRRAVTLDPDFADARWNLGRMLADRGAPDEALACFEAVLALEPVSVEVLNDLGLLLQAQGRFGAAAAYFQRAALLAPDRAILHYNLGAALASSGEAAAAEASLRRALDREPGLAQAAIALGNVLRAQDRVAEAIADYRRALTRATGDATLLNQLGTALLRLDQVDEAEAVLAEAVAHAPDEPAIRVNYGNAAHRLGRTEAALAAYRRALELDPGSADAHNNLAGVLSGLGRRDEAIAEYHRALALRPGFADAHFNLGNVLLATKRFDAAAAAFRRALDVEPGHPPALASLVSARRFACDWSDFADDLAVLGRMIAAGQPGVDPFLALAYPLSPAQQRRCAELAVEHGAGRIDPLPSRPRRPAGPAVRLAYLSANYHGHAVASLIAELIERHDRRHFEVTGISFGPDDGGPLRQRLMRGFDRFCDVRAESDAAAARLVADLDIDIAIDLMGHTRDHRLGILAHRPAPLQVAFLGYPGTVGGGYIDYVVADPIVLPRDQQPFWTEQIVHLPGCYQVNNSLRPIPSAGPARAECGLPAQGFVFCCFNNNYKITPEIFAIWLRLLAAVPGSVLWLLGDNDDAIRRLARRAGEAGIDPARLVFAPIASPDFHLARHRCADLFLDTQPYNAHTTASDALRIGLPLVTCLGTSFAARVAGSLLLALDLPELIAADLAAYERLALDLARDPARLQSIRATLKRNAATAALFDGERFRVGLEAAYRHMIERQRGGLAPAGFAVAAGAPVAP